MGKRTYDEDDDEVYLTLANSSVDTTLMHETFLLFRLYFLVKVVL